MTGIPWWLQMGSAPTRDGRYSNISETAYHADRSSLSASGAKLLLPPGCPPKPNPAKFREAMLHRPKPKPVYDFGHLVHELRLGKGAGIKVIDAPNYNTKAAQQARDEAHQVGLTPALPKQIIAALRMIVANNKHPLAGQLFRRGHPEVSFYHTDPQTGVRLRMRADWVTMFNLGDGEQRLTVLDYKTDTTADPDELQRKFWSCGYYRQFAWYHDIVHAVMGEPPVFLFVVQSKEPPYQTGVVEYGPAELEQGRRENRDAIQIYAECTAANNWPDPPGSESVQRITLPPYAYQHSPTISDLYNKEEAEIA